MTGRTTDDATGQIIRSKPLLEPDTREPRDLSAWTVTLELYPPDGSATIQRSGSGNDAGRCLYSTQATDWQVGGRTIYGRWGVRFYANDGAGQNLPTPLGYVQVSRSKGPG